MDTPDLHRLFKQSSGVSTDSRRIQKACIYFALKGEHFDGNQFALSAIENGAAWAVVDNPDLGFHEKFILVPDVLKALQDLARYHRAQFRIPLIGITGTNGKTTTKELLTAVMSTQFITTATKGNLNNHIGVPLTLLEINHNTEFAIIEMGANHPGEIAELCSIALPNLGIITNIGKAHLEGFGSQENIINTKKALYDSVGQLPGVLFVNGDNPLLWKLSENYTRISYGSHTTYNYNGAIHTGTDVLDFSFKYQKKEYTVKTRLAGSYNFENAMAAVACGLHFEIHPVNIKTALEKYQPGNNRSQIHQTATNLLILDAYNANPSSMEAAIRNFKAMQYPREVLILGDMRELGAYEDEEHTKIASLVRELDLKSSYFIGPVFYRILKPETGYNVFPDVESARDFFKEHPLKDKTILIKGSRGIRLEVLNDTL